MSGATLLAGASLVVLLAGCAAVEPIDSLVELGTLEIAAGARFAGHEVGGLSGLDYDAAHGDWIAISDQRGDHGAPGIYRLHLDLDGNAAPGVTIGAAVALQAPPGHTYLRGPGDPASAEVADFEAVRIDPRDGSIWYAGEGSRARAQGPAVRRARPDGHFLAELRLPPALAAFPDRLAGVRENKSIEALTFSADGASLWVGLEAPLYEDGPPPSLEHGATVRLTRIGRDGVTRAQFAYELDPIAVAPAPGKLADNGLAEMLAIDSAHLLMLERSGAQDAAGIFHFSIRLYEAGLEGADDVRAMVSLAAGRHRPVRKRLLFTLAAAAADSANYEGMAWGPTLLNGHRSLVLVSDNNFESGTATRFLVLEVLPP
jgi:hypothetical protein